MSVRPPSTRPPTAALSIRRPTTAASTRETTNGGDADWVVAVFEAKGSHRQVAVAAIDVERSLCFLSQVCDTQTYVKTLHIIQQRYPATLVLPSQVTTTMLTVDSPSASSVGPSPVLSSLTILSRLIKNNFEMTPLHGLAKKHWAIDQGIELIDKLALDEPAKMTLLATVTENTLALAAFAGLIRHLEGHHRILYANNSLKIVFTALEGTMVLGTDTLRDLELLQNTMDGSSKKTLFDLLNSCMTPMGTRLLRNNITSPSADRFTLNKRLDAVQELVINRDTLETCRQALHKLAKTDYDKVIGKISTNKPRDFRGQGDPAREAEKKISTVLQLRTLLESLPSIALSIDASSSDLLKDLASGLRGQADVILDSLRDTINEDVVTSFQEGKGQLALRNVRVYAIRSERKLLLDVARVTYKENMQDLLDMANEMSAIAGTTVNLVPVSSGFAFSCSKDGLPGGVLPKGCTEGKAKSGKRIQFASADLKKRNARLQQSLEEVFLLSDEAIDELIEGIKQHLAFLFQCVEAISTLDVIASLAYVATIEGWTRPEFENAMAIKAGRHPLVERYQMRDRNDFIPNDTYISNNRSFQLITGINAAGKTVFTKQVALLVIMAQLGSFVPADLASFGIHDALLTRLNNDDDLGKSLSTFAVEMRSASMITLALDAFRAPLVVIDELGRGTDPVAGFGLCHAIAEEIIKKRAFCLFVTHFRELTLSLFGYSNVAQFHLEAKARRSSSAFSFEYRHHVQQGSNAETHYGSLSDSLPVCSPDAEVKTGLEAAKLVDLPSSMLDFAHQVSDKLAHLERKSRIDAQSTRDEVRRKEMLRIVDQLEELALARELSDVEIGDRMRVLQADLVEGLVRSSFAGRGQIKADVKLENRPACAGRWSTFVAVMTSTYSSILNDLNRDVARNQPADIWQFCANWFNARLEEQRAATRPVERSVTPADQSRPISPPANVIPAMRSSPTKREVIRKKSNPSMLGAAYSFGGLGSGIAPADPAPSPFSETPPALKHQTADSFGHDHPVVSGNGRANSGLRNEMPSAWQRSGRPRAPMTSAPSDDEGDSGGDDGPSSPGPPPNYNIGRRTSVSAESLDPDAAQTALPKTVIPKTASQRQRIEHSIEHNLLFRNLDEDQYNDVLNAMKEVRVPTGSEVIVQGAVGDYFYVVEEGVFEVWVRPSSAGTYGPDGQRASGPNYGKDSDAKHVATIESGGSFGELALMYNAPRSATVVAVSATSTLWALDRVTFRSILMEHTSRKRRMYETFLSEVPILVSLESHERAKIADALEARIYEEGEAIVKEGEVGKNFYIIESGSCEVTKRRPTGEERVVILRKGDYFGELALLNSAPRAATVRAIGDRVRVATLGSRAFHRLLGPCVEILQRRAGSYNSAPAAEPRRGLPGNTRSIQPDTAGPRSRGLGMVTAEQHWNRHHARPQVTMTDVDDADLVSESQYKAPAAPKDLEKLEFRDDSLKKQEEALGVGANATGKARVTVLALVLTSDSRPEPIVLDLTKPLPEAPLVIKEGATYTAELRFQVEDALVSGLRYLQVVKRAGIKETLQAMIGSFAPSAQVLSKKFESEEAPSGMIVRTGTYNVRSRCTDDDGTICADFAWSFKAGLLSSTCYHALMSSRSRLARTGRMMKVSWLCVSLRNSHLSRPAA
ncbi:uncharacterized protein L969DRAFT_97143 [Mixia osmundae IAM 14324]|uniref:uncharacterized protein n=1 Tax=Mixia osmundae (strain CBS 9802 / IAM 14324 / JCM 22182 / KY 12970) TaxID=764103 RepID=UPI0004A5524F|nr:uncharacterized protein L969DRAFT_97143 [Mixia osmundae IAM 14324]KEI36747.1 hypothetical protein L969DRAFT_97143 [Mixia osmundae IAM 14324]